MENKDSLINELKRIVYSDGTAEELNNFVLRYEEYLLDVAPTLMIGYHVDFYMQRGLITRGLNVLSNYKSRPYISMEVEDFMNELYESILDASSNKKTYTINDIKEDLFSSSFEKNLNALRHLSSMNIRSHLDLVKEFLNKNKDEKLHRILLIILIEQGINGLFDFHLGGVIRKLNPINITLPFETENYKSIIEYLNDVVKNPDSLNRLTEIYSTILTMSFPDDVFKGYDKETIYNVLLRIEKEMLGYHCEDSLYDEENELYESAIVYFY